MKLKIYKYRSFTLDDLSFFRLQRIVCDGLVWCARPDTLNDPSEFEWTCDFTESPGTIDVVADLLEEAKGHHPREARRRAGIVLASGAMSTLGTPVIADMIRKMRDDIGVASFGLSHANPILWSRYAAEGAGLAVQFEVPDELLGRHLHKVIYNDNPRIQIDDFIRSRNDHAAAAAVYSMLLTKTKAWEPEEEIRFLSKRPQVEVRIDGSYVTRILIGPRMTSECESAVRRMAGSIPVCRIPER